MKKYFILALSLFMLLCLCSCGNNNNEQITEPTTDEYMDAPATNNEYVSNSAPTTEAPIVSTTQTSPPAFSSAPVSQEPATQQTASQKPSTQQPHPQTETTAIPATTKKQLQKTGEMEFSDSGDNKYIKAVVDKYGGDSARLCAIYTVPDNDGNLVLEFDGSADANGKLIRNENTLIAIYSVDKELNCKRASENASLNEYSFAEMKVMFITTKKHIMPEFQTELDGK